MRIHFVIHESFEAPGAFETWARSHGYAVSYSRVYAGDALPLTTDGIDLLIVLGGPQSPSTTVRECAYFDAEAEKNLIARAISAGRAVVGVCLGSQLIGEALGANYEPSPHKEIGKFPINLTEAGLVNDKIKHFGASLAVGHWHNDMPGLTADSKVLAFSDGCPRQIVEYSDLVYGFQCHMEFTHEVVELLIAASERELATLTSHMQKWGRVHISKESGPGPILPSIAFLFFGLFASVLMIVVLSFGLNSSAKWPVANRFFNAL